METLLQPILIPLILGFVCLLFSRIRYIKEFISVVGSVYLFGLAIYIFQAQELVYSFGSLSIMNFSTELVLHSFHLSSLLLVFIFLFGMLVAIYSWSSQKGMEQDNKYYAFLMWTLGASAGVLLSDSLFLLLIFWELSTVMLFLLVGLGKFKLSSHSAGKTLAILGFSDVALLLGVIFIWVNYNTLLISQLTIATSNGFLIFVYILFFIAAIAKAGAIPFHSWIPDASEGAPTVVMGLIPSAVDKILGIYLLARITLDIFVINSSLSFIIMLVGVITIFFAVFMAIIQENLKKQLAFLLISSAGYMLLGLGTGDKVGISGGLFYMLNSTICYCCLFLCARSVEYRTGNLDLDKLGGLAKYMPITFVSTIIAALAISGLPPLNGFVSKWMVYQALVTVEEPIFLIIAVFGSALILAAFLKILFSVFLGGIPKRLESISLREVPFSMTLPVVILVLITIFFGIFAQFPVGKLLAPIVGVGEGIHVPRMLAFTNTLWSPTAATILIIVGLTIGLVVYLLGRSLKFRESSIYTCGEKLDPESARVAGTEMYNTIRDLKPLRVPYSDGARGVFDLYNIFEKLGGNTIVKGLKALHSGVLSNYVAWLIIGLTVIVFFLIR